MHVVSVKIGDHCYHGLCDIATSVSAIPYTLYQEIMNDIAPAEIEDIHYWNQLLCRPPWWTAKAQITDGKLLCRQPADDKLSG